MAGSLPFAFRTHTQNSKIDRSVEEEGISGGDVFREREDRSEAPNPLINSKSLTDECGN